jgi:protease-4
MGSPFRALTPDERAIFQSVIDELQRQFVAKVVERRRLDEATARGLADGRIFTAQQALDRRLVDAIGYMPDAVADARRAIGVDEAKVIVYRRPREYQATYYAQTRTEAHTFDMAVERLATVAGGAGPRFLYLWSP